MSSGAPLRGLDTRLLHAGEPAPRIHGAVTVPIFQSVTFEQAGDPDEPALRYIRLGNTNAETRTGTPYCNEYSLSPVPVLTSRAAITRGRLVGDYDGTRSVSHSVIYQDAFDQSRQTIQERGGSTRRG